MKGKGVLIVFEGIDGSGKSTHAQNLYQYLNSKKLGVVLTEEPSDSIWGEKIRELEANIQDRLTPEEQLNLFIKDRREHVALVIQPALDKKEIVITDRYYFSTIAYQGALGIDVNTIKEANQWAPEPDMVLYLNISPKDGLQRIRKRREGTPSQYEKEGYLKKVKVIFDRFDEPYFHTIDASAPIDAVSKNIINKVDDFLLQT